MSNTRMTIVDEGQCKFCRFHVGGQCALPEAYHCANRVPEKRPETEGGRAS